MTSYLDLLLQDIGAPSLPHSTRASILQLYRQIPGQPVMQDELELVIYAAALLHKQNRMQDIISAHSSGGAYSLQKHELIWAALYPHLLRFGYRLSARYAPGWHHSGSARSDEEHEDQHDPNIKPLEKYSYRAVPATRVDTGEQTVIKILFRRPGHPSASEQDVLQFLNADPQRSDPRNVCVPVIEFIECPSLALKQPAYYSMVVMPSLRGCETLRGTVESLDVLRQALQGLTFLHELGIAHGDLCALNAMYSRDAVSQRPRLAFIDFGLATWFASGTTSRLARWNEARQPLPELAQDDSIEYDTFKADVYACGVTFQPCMFRALPHYYPLYGLMTARNPNDRPSALECLQVFDAILASSPWHQKVPTDALETPSSKHDMESAEQTLAHVPQSHPFLAELVL